MDLYLSLVTLEGLVILLMLLRDWRRVQDPLYPTMFLMPMLFVLYVIFPLHLLNESEPWLLHHAGGAEPLVRYAVQTLLVTSALYLGTGWGAARDAHCSPVNREDDDRLYILGIVIASAGCAVFYGALQAAGGIAVVYATSYSGVYIENGWISEIRNWGLAAPPCIMLARRQRRMRGRDWVIVLVAVSPLLVQGLLGARRGPSFLALAIVAGGYIAIFRPKIPFTLFLGSAAAMAFALLALVANRDAIHIGLTMADIRPPWAAIVDFEGNEYVYGLAFLRYVESGASPFYGRRVLGHLLGRVAPKAVWPDAYGDVADALSLQDVDYRINAGAPVLRIESALGYAAPQGAAPGIVGELYLEFGPYLSLPLAFLIGAILGYLWQRATVEGRLQFVVAYLLLASLSIYLVAQSLEAWLYRALLLALPAWFLTGWLDRSARATQDD